MTEKIEHIFRRFVPVDGDILVMTPGRPLTSVEMRMLDEQVVNLTHRINTEYNKNISSVVLPYGFKLELLNVNAPKPSNDLGEAYTVEVAAREFAKQWEYESSSAEGAAIDAFIAGNAFKAPKPVEPEPTTRLHFNEYLLREFYTEGEHIRRQCWPPGDYISADGAEGGTLWYYTAKEDEFTRDYKLGFHDLGAFDWEIV